MPTPTPRTVEYYNLSDVVFAITQVRHIKYTLIDLVSHSDFTFGTNTYTLIGIDELAKVWRDEGYKLAADRIIKTFGAESLVNLEA